MEFVNREPLKSDLVKYTKLFIDGSFVDAISGKTFTTYDPTTTEALADVPLGDADDIDLAVKAARKAFDDGPWPRLPATERGKILFKLADLMEKNLEKLITLETLNNGMPVQSSHFTITGAVAVLRYYAGWADKISGKTLKAESAIHAYTLYEPLGVVGAIIPWNFPLYLLACKIAPALACGNTVVIKPAELSPLTALYFASLAQEAGIPSGVVNVVTGVGVVAGAAISKHMDVDKVTFTGSTSIGRLVMQDAAESNLKQVSLELGGKSPVIVCEDADINTAAFFANLAVFTHQGQVCVAGSRVLVHESVYEQFVNTVVAIASGRVIGDPLDAKVDHGPQINEAQMEKVLSYIKLGEEEGARLVKGGKRIGDKGYYIEPTIFADVEPSMKIAQEEIFGPVLSVMKFKTHEEAVKLANNTSYGLAAAVFTKDLETANMFTRSIKSGLVYVNTYFAAGATVPFGGYKMSGFGRDNGFEGMLPYLQVKSVVMPLSNSPWL